MNIEMPPRADGKINVTHEEVEDARQATEDVLLVRPDGTLTPAGMLYVADVRRTSREADSVAVTRYWIHDRIVQDEPWVGMPYGAATVGIVDENEGGVILYCHNSNAQKILSALITQEASA